MVKYTPGGARNFLVPSRSHHGKFYALAESPQLFKQLYMVAGFDRYFQIVKCFRDEDLRLDRQPEFTQIDVEMSFVNQDDIFRTIEGLVFKVWKDVLGVDLLKLYPSGAFPRMPFEESMRDYGNDKPDLRFALPHIDLTELVVEHGGGGVSFWKTIADKFASGEYRRDLPQEIVKGLRIPGELASGLSRAEIDKLEDFVKGMGAKGLARAKVDGQGQWVQSPLAKMISPGLREAINARVGARDGDLVFFQFGRESAVQTVMANLRLHLGKKLGLIPDSGHGGKWNFLWVVNPPLFEYDEDRKGWAAAHHAFTRPHDDCVDLLDKDPGKVLCWRYDLVLNGVELGGGSIRLHDPAVQAKVFRALGISDEEARSKFGFLLDALKHGAPPHGGIALGMDRLAMLLSGAESLRDVIPFPKTQKGTDLDDRRAERGLPCAAGGAEDPRGRASDVAGRFTRPEAGALPTGTLAARARAARPRRASGRSASVRSTGEGFAAPARAFAAWAGALATRAGALAARMTAHRPTGEGSCQAGDRARPADKRARPTGESSRPACKRGRPSNKSLSRAGESGRQYGERGREYGERGRGGRT